MSSIQDALAGLEFTSELDGDLVSDAVVLLRLVNAETGRGTVLCAVSDHTDYITTLGLIEAAKQIHSGPWGDADEDEDD